MGFNLNEKEALAYLKANGHEISAKTYWRTRAWIKKNSQNELFEHGKQTFLREHLERIQKLRWCENELFKRYYKEDDNLKASMILMKIEETQFNTASFADATRAVIENRKPEIKESLPEFTEPAQ